MKKIIFVEKEQTNYDPVTAFFGKKTQSIAKNTTTKIMPPSKASEKRIPISNTKPEKQTIKGRNIQKTPQINTKYQKGTQILKKQESYELSHKQIDTKTNMKRTIEKQQSDYSQSSQIKQKNSNFQQNVKTQLREDSIDKLKEESSKVVEGKMKKNVAQDQKSQNLSKKIKDLQARQSEYLRKIQEFQAKEQKYVKSQQKLLKLQKQYKTANIKAKQTDSIAQRLKQKQNQVKQLMQGTNVPYNKKRQILLANKLRELKRLNRQLTLRLKNYKGTDLVEMATQQNREQITKDLYAVDVQKQLNAQMNIQMQALSSELINKIQTYIQKRTKTKGSSLGWTQQYKFLLQLSNTAQKLSLNYLQKYQICPLPKSNQEAVSVYSILEKYKQNNQFKKIIQRFELNYKISEQNTQILNFVNDLHQKQINITNEFKKNKKKQNLNKQYLHQLNKIVEKRANLTEILLIKNICQTTCLKQMLCKMHNRLKQQIGRLSLMMIQISDIVKLGSNGKQSLFLYLQTNISQIQSRFPSIKAQIKQTQVNFDQLQKNLFL